MRQYAAVFLVLGLLGCNSTEPEHLYAFSGRYDLSTLAGKPIPGTQTCLQPTSRMETCEVFSGYLEVTGEHTAVLYLTEQQEGHPEIFSTVLSYTFTRSGNRATMTSVPDAYLDETFVVNIGDGTVTKGTMVFVRAE